MGELKPIPMVLSIVCLVCGLGVSFRGFLMSNTATWASSMLASGFSWLLFGIALLILGTALAVYAKE